MNILKTDKETLSDEDILNYISDYEMKTVPELNLLWKYYRGENTKILSKPKPDANSPDNRTVIAYGRKLVTTWTGYGWRPRYITYKATNETNQSGLEDEEVSKDNTIDIEAVMTEVVNEQTPKEKKLTQDELYVKELQTTFNLNNEHIKTSRAGRNIGIFGVSYEIVYIDKVFNLLDSTTKAEPKFFTIDPREMILLYDYESEPKKKIGIRFYEINSDWYKVEVYYKDKIEIYDRKRDKGNSKWVLIFDSAYPNFFKDVPIVAYYAGDEMLGVIKPVLSLIDDNDILFSDSMNEFDKFAFAYLIMKKYRITNPVDMRTPGKSDKTLQDLKKKRVFEDVPTDGEIKFLLKDIPKDFIEFMTKSIREQIHIQSHVPDFNYMATGSLSGAAIERLMFDFENLVSSSDADFDVGLLERIRLITIIYKLEGRPIGNNDMITISHKRNIPFNLLELAQTAVQMKTAGFSAYLIADIMPDDIIPNIQVELARQRKENEAMIGNDLEGLGNDGLEENNDIDINNNDENL